MIAGRPVNLWLGLTTAISGAVVATLIALGFDPAVVGTLGSVWSGVLGAGILVVANQSPTLSPGDTYKIQTPSNQPNYEATVATPPAPTKPTIDPESIDE